MDHVTHASLPELVRIEGYFLSENHAPIKIKPRRCSHGADNAVVNHHNAVDGRIRAIYDADLVLPIGHEQIA